MPIVKVRIFSRTEQVTGVGYPPSMIESVRAQAETFLATLAINDVCDVREQWATVGKDTTFSVFQMSVYYLEEP